MDPCCAARRCLAVLLMHQGTLQSSLSPPHRNKSTNKCSQQEPRRTCFELFVVQPTSFSSATIGPCDTNVMEGHLFLRDNDINDALQFEIMFSPLATQQMSYDLFCVQQPFATLFWTFPGRWVFCSKTTFDGSIDTPTSSRDVWAHKISWYSTSKLVRLIRFSRLIS